MEKQKQVKSKKVKGKKVMKELTLLWVLIFTFQLFAQNNNVALKFDEFSYLQNQYGTYYSSPKISDYDRTIRFAQEVTKHKDSNAYVIFYNQRKGKYPLDKATTESQEVVRFLTNKPKYTDYRPNPKYPISPERVIVIDGGYREEATLEFWIVPQNAEPPKPTPTFSLSEIAVCPEINVAGDGFRKDRNQPLKFSVAIKDEEPNSKLSLEWSVSVGKIIKGQNTNQIEVDLSETNDKFISASVQVKGLHPECENHDFASTRVDSYPYKIDEFSHILYSELSARFDGFMFYLIDEPNSTGYMIIYGSRDGNKKDVARMVKMTNQIMVFRRYDSSRVIIVDGGYREEMMIEFYVVPAGVEPPKPTPTLDSSFVVPPKKIVKKRKRVSK